jgi:hypothetical protein
MNSSNIAAKQVASDAGKLQRLWEWWKRTAIKIGDFNARLILTIFYFILLAPFSLLVRILDPMAIHRKARHGWMSRQEPKEQLLDYARKQS